VEPTYLSKLNLSLTIFPELKESKVVLQEATFCIEKY
jgi:hypothetical protein